MAGDVVFRTEVLKLMLQVAWADDELHGAELERVLRLGQQWQVPDATMAALRDAVVRKTPLPAPDLALLRRQVAEVMALARAFVAADGDANADEKAFLHQLEQLLTAS